MGLIDVPTTHAQRSSKRWRQYEWALCEGDMVTNHDGDEVVMVFSPATNEQHQHNEANNPAHQSSNEQSDAPEAIIRRENQVIRLLRVLTALFLLLAAAATVTFIYLYLSRNQMDRFQSEYTALSSTLASSLFLDMRLNFWIARTLSKTVSLAMVMSNQPVTNFTIPASLWDGVTEEARWVGDHIVVSWIPFLYTDEERLAFEEHVRSFSGDEQPVNSTDKSPCYICGDPTSVVQDPSTPVELTGLTFTCGDVYESGIDGAIPPDLCQTAKEVLEPICPCVNASQNENQTQNGALNNGAHWNPNDGLYTYGDGVYPIHQDFGQAPYAPMYAISARGNRHGPSLYNAISDPVRRQALTAVMFNGKPAMTEMRLRDAAYYRYKPDFMSEQSSDLYYPVFSSEPESRRVIGAVGLEFLWNNFTTGAVPAYSNLVSLVIENTCGQAHTYAIDTVANRLLLLGTSDLHDRKFDAMAQNTSFEEYDTILRTSGSLLEQADYCSYRFVVYPTQALADKYLSTGTGDPALFAALAGLIFVFTTLVFVFYDTMVRRRQAKVMASAKRSNDIVSSLFPENVRGRLYERAATLDMPSSFAGDECESRYLSSSSSTATVKSNSIFGSDPIADLFPHTTIMFLDIAGFTAWSSERDPSQVFVLLESLYHAFDCVARQLGVFKVETIGDCYVAVAGLPKPRRDHAVGKPNILPCSTANVEAC
jgi:Adenylate and Guanylate cyclase catalytic domain